jgi:RimJ/RimL family protein N-acetyltransferase
VPEILGHAVWINDLRPADAAAFFAYRAQEEVARFQSPLAESVDEALKFIERNAAKPFDRPGSWYQLAVRPALTNDLVGDLGVHCLPGGQQVEIGVTIAPAHQRRGFAAAAVTALLDHLFTVMHKHRVCASVDPRNEGSMALLRRIGMRQEAHFRHSVQWRGEWVDDVVFGILESEWKPYATPSSRAGGGPISPLRARHIDDADGGQRR